MGGWCGSTSPTPSGTCAPACLLAPPSRLPAPARASAGTHRAEGAADVGQGGVCRGEVEGGARASGAQAGGQGQQQEGGVAGHGGCGRGEGGGGMVWEKPGGRPTFRGAGRAAERAQRPGTSRAFLLASQVLSSCYTCLAVLQHIIPASTAMTERTRAAATAGSAGRPHTPTSARRRSPLAACRSPAATALPLPTALCFHPQR